MKKSICLLVVLSMVLTLAGCGSKSEEPAVSAETAETETAENDAEETENSDAESGLTEPVNLIFATAGTGSVDYALGGLLVSLFQEYLPEGSNVTQETISSGNSGAGYLIEAGLCDISRGQNAVSATVGMDGREPFTSVRSLVSLNSANLTCYIFAPGFVEKTGYDSLKDIVENQYPVRICTEDIGSSDYIVLTYVLEILGSSIEEIESWGGSVTYTSGSTCAEMLQDGQADLMMPHTSATSSTISELALTTDVEMYPFEDDIIDALLEKGFSERTIPAGTFDRFESDCRTAAMGTCIIVGADMDDAVAYELTKILVEHAEEDLGEENVQFKDLTPDILTDESISVVPFHDGAIAYFKDAGMM